MYALSLMTKNVLDFIGLTVCTSSSGIPENLTCLSQNFDIALSSVTASTDVLLSATLVALLALSRTGSVG